jgi:hypothetical protein
MQNLPFEVVWVQNSPIIRIFGYTFKYTFIMTKSVPLMQLQDSCNSIEVNRIVGA